MGHYIAKALEAAGVRHVFGIPGVHNLELYRGLEGASLQHISARHEQGLGFMADGYARSSGRPGVCWTIGGPGVSNIATALGQAYADSVPLLLIASQNRRTEAGSGRGFLHELPDQRALAAAVTAASFAIESPEALPEALSRSFELFATQRPRPVYIEIPRDLLAADAQDLALPRFGGGAPPRPDAPALAAAAAALRAARRPVVLAGGGARRAAEALRALVERLGAPLVMTANARGLLPPDHALAVAASPSLEAVRALIAAADTVLAVGTEIGPTDYDMYSVSEFPGPGNLIRIDIDARQLNRNATPRIPLCGDAAATLQMLLALDLGGSGERRAAAATAAAAVRLRARAQLLPVARRHLEVLESIRDALPEAVLVGDSTQLVYAGNLGFAAASPGSWFSSATGYGTLGYALPASVGAAVAVPDRPIVCLIGDGGLQFCLGELAVPRETDAWMAIAVWNNQGYEEIRSAMIAAGITPRGVDVQPPQLRRLACAYGYAYRLIESPQALHAALRSFGRRRQVVLLELAARMLEADSGS